ncbi:MAG: amidohydrolase [Candidatus Planktophila sp.]|nr:amidohydrolase [Candidatus Planktophila sp.]
MNNYIIHNAQYVVCVDEKNQILEGATIVIRNGLISQINPPQIPTGSEYEHFDAKEHLVMPGLVNTHAHLAMALLRGWAEGVNLDGFLELVWAAEGAIMDAPTCALGTELGAGEALLSGTTTVLDMYLHPEVTHQAAIGVGLRHVTGPIFFDFPGLDGMEWDDRIAFARSWPALHKALGGPWTPLFLMPHSVYTDSEAHLKEVAELAKEFGARIHLHLSETEAENSMSLKTHGRTPTQVILDAGILDVPTTYGHGVYLSEQDVRTTAKHGASVAHCPGSNLKLGNGIANIQAYQEAGIAVGLGTDSCSSSNDLDMWSVLRLTAQLFTFTHKPKDLDLSMIIRAATIEGARAIGLSEVVGSIEIGKEADLIAISLNALHLTPIHNVLALLVFAAGRSDVSDVWVSGERVVTTHRLTKIDPGELRRRILDRASALDSIR